MARRLFALALAMPLLAAARPVRAEALPADLSRLFADAVTQTWPTGRMPVGAGTTDLGDPFVLTAAHVIAGCRHVEVARGGSLQPVDIVGLDTRLDLALLQERRAGRSAESRLADAMTIVPDGARPSLARLQVVAFGQPAHDAAEPIRFAVQASSLVQDIERPVLSLSGKLVPGTSGSPVLDEDGQSIGMVVGQLRADRHQGVAVRSKDLLRFLAYFGLTPSVTPGRHPAQGVMVQCTG